MRVDAVRRVGLLAIEAREQVRDELGDVLGALAQRRQLDADDREALVEVGAELAAPRRARARSRLVAATMRKSTCAPRVLAEPADTTWSSSTRSSLICSVSGVSSISSRNTVPPRGRGEQAVVVVDRARERAAHVAEQLGLHQLVRDRRAVDRHERRRCAPRARVEEARGELLAGAGLAGEQHRHRRARRAIELAEQRASRPRSGR